MYYCTESFQIMGSNESGLSWKAFWGISVFITKESTGNLSIKNLRHFLNLISLWDEKKSVLSTFVLDSAL